MGATNVLDASALLDDKFYMKIIANATLQQEKLPIAG